MEWLQENWVNITAAIGAIVTGASILVKLTPTKKDDRFFSKYVIPILNLLALNPKK